MIRIVYTSLNLVVIIPEIHGLCQEIKDYVLAVCAAIPAFSGPKPSIDPRKVRLANTMLDTGNSIRTIQKFET